MADGHSNKLLKPVKRSKRWTSFVGTAVAGRVVRGLQEERNPAHRLRVEHNQHTLLIHISNEDGDGWTTIALDRATREWSIAQRLRQLDAAKAAYEQLYI
ncbi:MAG: hypothetical protein ND895_02365 [Pyrinomonadaceae bacterium]|nr:hypothetical protein [Pyrinomonadaceae bacterium]